VISQSPGVQAPEALASIGSQWSSTPWGLEAGVEHGTAVPARIVPCPNAPGVSEVSATADAWTAYISASVTGSARITARRPPPAAHLTPSPLLRSSRPIDVAAA
jgi:hypothetical protein